MDKDNINVEKPEDVTIEEVTEEVKDPGALWEDYVRDEVNSLLDIFLPTADFGNVGIKYVHPTLNQFEGGEGGSQENKEKAIGVRIGIVFSFTEEIDLKQEMEEDE